VAVPKLYIHVSSGAVYLNHGHFFLL